jgi:ABC-type thiamine transport system ATPase subunit
MMPIDATHQLHLNIEEILGQRIAVLGISGSGKSNTVAVLAEELLPHIPLTICVLAKSQVFFLKRLSQ